MFKAVIRLAVIIFFVSVLTFTIRPSVFDDFPVISSFLSDLVEVCQSSSICESALSSLAGSAPTLNEIIDGFWNWILALTIDDVINTLVIGGLLAIGNVLLNWYKFRPIRSLCAQQLYVTTYELLDSLSKISRNIVEEDGTVWLEINKIVKEELFQLAQQMQILSDFSIAYEHSFPRKLRKIAVPFRMYVVDAQARIKSLYEEACEVSPDDSDIGGRVDLHQQKYASWRLKKPGIIGSLGLTRRSRKMKKQTSGVHVIDVSFYAVDATLYLATRLERRFRPKWLPFIGRVFGRAAPPAIRDLIQGTLYGREGLFARIRKGDFPDILLSQAPSGLAGSIE